MKTFRLPPSVLFWMAQAFLFFLLTTTFKYLHFEDLEFTGDNYQYLQLAKNLSEGNGYGTTVAGTFTPSNWFPPAYPAMLAFLKKIGIQDTGQLKWINLLLFFIGWCALTWRLHRLRAINFFVLVTSGVLLMANAPFIAWSNKVMSEMLFFMFTALAFAVWPLVEAKWHWKSKALPLTLLFIAGAYYTRGIGVALLAGMGLHLLVEKRWRTLAALVLGFGLLAAPWSLRNASHGLGGRYLSTMTVVNPWNDDLGKVDGTSGWITKLERNAYDTIFKGFTEVSAPGVPLPKDPTTTMWIWGVLFLALLGWGISRWKSMNWSVAGYLAASAVIFLLWHGGNGARYVYPLTPLLVLGFMTGAADLAQRVAARLQLNARWSPLLLLALLFWMRPPMEIAHQAQANHETPGQAAFIQHSDTLRMLAAETDVIVSRKPEITSYLCDRKSVRFPFTSDSLAMLDFFVKHDPKYIIIDANTGFPQAAKFLVPFLNRHKTNWAIVDEKKLGNTSGYLLVCRPGAFTELKAKWEQAK